MRTNKIRSAKLVVHLSRCNMNSTVDFEKKQGFDGKKAELSPTSTSIDKTRPKGNSSMRRTEMFS